jgi:hypothetical protein
MKRTNHRSSKQIMSKILVILFEIRKSILSLYVNCIEKLNEVIQIEGEYYTRKS